MHTIHSSPLTNLARCCLVALAVLPGCDEVATPAIEPNDADLLTPRVLPVDPSTVEEFVSCPADGTFAGIAAEVRYPGDAGCNPVEDSPLVVLLRGNDFHYQNYTYLLDHLARNGFVAVCANILASDNEVSHTAKAKLVEDVLNDMRTTWTHGDTIDPTRLAIVGHSRGGQTARYLAYRLKGNADDWTVRAIVGLASSAGTDKPITGDMTTGLLLIQGSLDEDQAPDRAYALYDGTGSEGSVPFADPNGIYKAMKLLPGGNHVDFLETLGNPTFRAHVAKGYVLAFLAAHLRGDITWYEDYIRGEAVPNGWTADVVTQVSDGFFRKVVDNFQDHLLAFPTIGGAASYSPGLVASVVDLGPDADAQHETWALRLSSAAPNDAIAWTFPAQNLTEVEWLSIRIGQTSGAAATGLSVHIRNNGDWAAPVAITDHGPIPQPLGMCHPWASCNPPTVYDHMGTVRVPLSVFGAHGAVDGVRFVFQGDSAGKDFVIDSIEFAEWIYKP